MGGLFPGDRRLLEADGTGPEAAEAVIFVNDTNLTLLELSDKITQTVVDDSIQVTKQTETVFIGLQFLLFLIVLISLYNLQQYIVRPFGELYQGISEIGLSISDSSPRKTRNFLPESKDLTPVAAEIKAAFGKVTNLISLIENVNRNSNFIETLNFIYKTFSPYVPYVYIGIALFDKDKNTLKQAYGASDGTITGLPSKVLSKPVNVKNTSLEKVLEGGEARVINDLVQHTANRPVSDYNRAILEAGIRSSITLPLKISDEPIGIIFFSSNKANVYTEEHVKFLRTLANSLAISFEKNYLIDDLLYGGIFALAKLAEARDEDTGDHLERMKQYSRLIAELLYENSLFSEEITLEYIDNIERFSPLHDIGKVGIRDDILLKPGKLNPAEFEEMKKHTSYGADVLRATVSSLRDQNRQFFTLGIEIAESHHERWDGSGYPNGKAGPDIPLSARIIAVADVFDALTSRRPYKEPFPFDESFAQVLKGSGTHFDPQIISIFQENEILIYELYRKFYP